MYAELWQMFGIPGHVAPGVDARWVRRASMVRAAQAEGGDV